MPIPLLALAIGSALFSAARSIKQNHDAKTLERDNQRPSESVPQGVLDATAYSRMLSMIGMPAEQFNAAMRDIDRAGINTIAAARDRRGAIDVAGTVQQATNDATLNLEGKSADMRVRNTGMYIDALGNLGQWQDKIWSYNQQQKYQENAAAIRALKTAANANMNNAMNTVLSGVAMQYGGSNIGGTPATTGAATTSTTDAATPQEFPTGSYAQTMAAFGGGNFGNNAAADAVEDPTVTNPELFHSQMPQGLVNYLKALDNPNGPKY